MVEILVTKSFKDKYNISNTFEAGTTICVDENRATSIINKGLGKLVTIANVEKVQETASQPEASATETSEAPATEDVPKRKRGRKPKNK